MTKPQRVALKDFFKDRFMLKQIQRVTPNATRSLAEILAADGRPPVVYLRPFDADFGPEGPVELRTVGLVVSPRTIEAIRARIDNLPLPRPVRGLLSGATRVVSAYNACERILQKGATILLGPLAGSFTLDFMLGNAFAQIGPVVTLGRPGEHFAPRGLSRVYARNETWREEVGALLRSARVVIIRPDLTPGIQWELEIILSSCDPRRLCMVFWGTERWRYSEIRDNLTSFVAFPPYSALERRFRGQVNWHFNRLTLFHYGVIDDGAAKLRSLTPSRSLDPRTVFTEVVNEMKQRCESLPAPALYVEQGS